MRTCATGGQGASSERNGFALLFMNGVLDTSVRMGLLLFLPFLLKAKGASLAIIGASLSLVFIGGAFGKFVCGWLGARVGMIRTVLATEAGTAICILAVLLAPNDVLASVASAGCNAKRHIVSALWNGSRIGAYASHGARLRSVLHRHNWLRRRRSCHLRYLGRRNRNSMCDHCYRSYCVAPFMIRGCPLRRDPRRRGRSR
jgi:hypothetical protein